MVAIDGCQVGCAKAILKNAGVPLNYHLVLTEEGMEKNKNFDLERSEIERAKTAVKRVAGQVGDVEAGEPSASGCSCSICG